MRCNEVNGQARLRITCLPRSHQRPGDLGNSLGLGEHHVFTRLGMSLHKQSLLPHTTTCYMLNGTDGWWVWREHTILIQPGIRILVYKLCTIATLSLRRFRGTRPLAGLDLRSSETDCGARPGRVRLEEALCFCMRAVVHCMCLRAVRKFALNCVLIV